jgi:hypothetical protein
LPERSPASPAPKTLDKERKETEREVNALHQSFVPTESIVHAGKPNYDDQSDNDKY